MKEWSVKNWFKQAAPTSATPPVQQIKTPKRSHKDEKASASAKQFLTSLPKLPSYYYQADTNKQYLEPVFERIFHYTENMNGFVGTTICRM